MAGAVAPVLAEDKPLLTGAAAFGDWTAAAPGVRRLIRPSDLPPPNPAEAAANGPRLVARPANAAPLLPPGFTATAYVTGLNEPRQMRLAPNGDVFLAESGARQVRVIRAASGADRAASAEVFVSRLDVMPYGIAFYPPGPEPQFVYVATQSQVLRFPYRNGDTKARGEGEVVLPHLPRGGHLTRDIVFTPDGKKLLLSVGSASNAGESGMKEEEGRADILEFNPDGSGRRLYASGLRNPVTIAFHPATGDLWTTVNERDLLGDNLPPDYVTRVADGGFYGWPWFYIGAHQDPAFPGVHPELRRKVLVPDVLFQAHSAPLGFAIYDGRQFPPEYRGDLFVALHGSWNRAKRTGYKLVRIHLEDGKPSGEYQDFMTGFVVSDGDVWGRPVGVATAADGALLVSDDASGTVWRIAYTGGK
jgi:glucose/arabinose dehydrogenase